jgi:integrase
MGVKVRKCRKSWYIFVYHHGQRKAKRVGSREAAEKVRREVEARLAMGDLGVLSQEASGIPTLAHYVASWQKNYAAREMKPSTADFYDQFLRLYVLPTFGDSQLDQIRRDAVKRWITALTARGLARNTVRLAVASIRAVLNIAIEDGLIISNPAQRLGRLIKSEKPERQATALTKEEVDRFLNGAKQFCAKHYPFFLTALRAGLREGELVALKWGDMQFGNGEDDANRYILVQRTYDRRSKRFLTTKSKRPRRVDMSRELRDVLLKRRDQALVEAVKRCRESIDGEFVFPSKAGTVLDITNLVPRDFLPLLKRVGLRRIRFHDLRHTFGSLLIEAGAPLTYVRDQMGHSSIKLTVDTYGHMVPGSNVRYIDRLDNRETSPPKNANPAQTRGARRMSNSLQVIGKNGAPGETRTPDLQIRSLPLYPTELQARCLKSITQCDREPASTGNSRPLTPLSMPKPDSTSTLIALRRKPTANSASV